MDIVITLALKQHINVKIKVAYKMRPFSFLFKNIIIKVIILKKSLYKWLVLLLLALLCPNIWIYSTNVIFLIPLFAIYVSEGKGEGIVFAIMSCVTTYIYGYMYALILLLSYVIYILLYRISSMIFLDDVDCSMVSCFMSVFILCIERHTNNVNVGTFFLCLLFSLISFWMYFIVYLCKDLFDSYVGNKKFNMYISVYQSSFDNKFCGDCYDYFNHNSKKYILFCDGMYVGEEAFNLSSQVLSSIRCGIESGYDVNNVVSNCSRCLFNEYNCESFSTLDLIELDGNKLSFIKRGSENSLLIRNKDVISISNNSLPMGVDGDNTNVNTRIKDEDILVIYSDGVKEKYPLFDAMVKDKVYGDRLELWVEKLVCEKYEGQRDDMSVLVIKFVDIS